MTLPFKNSQQEYRAVLDETGLAAPCAADFALTTGSMQGC
jgi:hypothetical protein